MEKFGGQTPTEVDAIAKVPGIDVLFVGPFDLGNNIGHSIIDGTIHDDLKEAIAKIQRAAKENEKSSGIYATSGDQAREFADQGFNMVSVMTDTVALPAYMTSALTAAKGSYRYFVREWAICGITLAEDMSLQPYIDKKVLVITADGRTLTGTLLSCDQLTNVVLRDTIERVIRPHDDPEDSEEVPHGLYLIRGENVAICGLLDEQMDGEIDWAKVKGGVIRGAKHT
ncbi:MAG: hypothetical protein Q9175_006592 [Cornicularia normoerica]